MKKKSSTLQKRSSKPKRITLKIHGDWEIDQRSELFQDLSGLSQKHNVIFLVQ